MKLRILTASLLIFFVLLAVYWLPAQWFKLAAAVLILFVSFEWAGLCKTSSAALKILYMLLLGLVILAGQWLGLGYILLITACVFWVIGLFAVMHYAKGGRWFFLQPWLYWVSGWVFLSASYYALCVLRLSYLEADWFLLSLASVWIMDSGAYFIGRVLGKHSLAKRVSPNKTWEGFVGGLLCLLLYIAILYIYYPPLKTTPLLIIALLLSGLWSVIGDLFESVCKREVGVKDSGAILPGHGGLWDRLDGMLAALPWLAIITLWH